MRSGDLYQYFTNQRHAIVKELGPNQPSVGSEGGAPEHSIAKHGTGENDLVAVEITARTGSRKLRTILICRRDPSLGKGRRGEQENRPRPSWRFTKDSEMVREAVFLESRLLSSNERMTVVLLKTGILGSVMRSTFRSTLQSCLKPE